jgi:hypothetical protein
MVFAELAFVFLEVFKKGLLVRFCVVMAVGKRSAGLGWRELDLMLDTMLDMMLDTMHGLVLLRSQVRFGLHTGGLIMCYLF